MRIAAACRRIAICVAVIFWGLAGAAVSGQSNAAPLVIVTEIRLNETGDAGFVMRIVNAERLLVSGLPDGSEYFFVDAVGERNALQLEQVAAGAGGGASIVSAVAPGFAALRRGRYELEMPEGAVQVNDDPHFIVTVHCRQSANFGQTIFVNKYLLPETTQTVSFDSGFNSLSYELDIGSRFLSSGSGDLAQDLTSRWQGQGVRNSDLAGRWEFDLAGLENVNDLPLVYLDLFEEGGGLAGFITMDVFRDGSLVLRPEIREGRVEGKRFIFTAVGDTPRRGKAMQVQFDLDAVVDGEVMAGDVGIAIHIQDEMPVREEMRLKFRKMPK